MIVNQANCKKFLWLKESVTYGILIQMPDKS